MTREDILEICRRAPAIGAVKHEEFADYVVVLNQRKKIDDEWTNVEHPYMAVDGKLVMANEDHRRQGKRLDFGSPQVLVDNEDQLTLMVSVKSEIYGERHGIATSRRVGGTNAEREFPWEVAETSAIGRALSAMGYGLFPGSGLASAEDMLRSSAVGHGERKPAQQAARDGGRSEAPQNNRAQASAHAQPSLSAVQRRKLLELYTNLHGGSEAEAARGLDSMFVETFKHPMTNATYEEGARITAQLLAAQRAK
jgi:hypothetical protein